MNLIQHPFCSGHLGRESANPPNRVVIFRDSSGDRHDAAGMVGGGWAYLRSSERYAEAWVHMGNLDCLRAIVESSVLSLCVNRISFDIAVGRFCPGQWLQAPVEIACSIA